MDTFSPQLSHVPVLRNEVLDWFARASNETSSSAPLFLDCTLGAGGHSQSILSTVENSSVIGLDRDPSVEDLPVVRTSVNVNGFCCWLTSCTIGKGAQDFIKLSVRPWKVW